MRRFQLCLTLICLGAFFFFGCSSGHFARIEDESPYAKDGEVSVSSSHVNEVSPQAPWEFWSPVAKSEYSWQQASEYEHKGKLKLALLAYEKSEASLERSAKGVKLVPSDLLFRKLSLMLKMGKGGEVLKAISAFSGSQNKVLR